MQIGFFPKVESRKMISENPKIYYFLEDFVAYGRTAWWKLREKEVVIFNLFSYLTTESSPVREVPIATCQINTSIMI